MRARQDGRDERGAALHLGIQLGNKDVVGVVARLVKASVKCNLCRVVVVAGHQGEQTGRISMPRTAPPQWRQGQ